MANPEVPIDRVKRKKEEVGESGYTTRRERKTKSRQAKETAKEKRKLRFRKPKTI